MRRNIIPVFIIAGLLILSLFTMITLQASAQGGGDNDVEEPFEPDGWYLTSFSDEEWAFPYYQPGTSSGDAIWTVGESSFESLYPTGFEFEAVASSSGGEIVEASVIWSHTPEKLKRREAQVNPTTGRISLRWSVDESLPPWVAVNYYWSFIDSAGNRFRTGWILGEEYSDDFDTWERFENEEVIVFIQDGLPVETAELTLQAMEDQNPTFLQAWGGPLSYKPRVILFSVRDDFERWRSGFGGGAVIGQTSDDWGATVQVIVEDDISNLTYGTVLHEIGHLYQFEFAPDAFPPGTWLTEGNASFFELSQEYDFEARIRDFAENDELPILLEGPGPNAFASGPDGRGRLGYDVGYTFFHWLTINYGLDAHRELIEGLAAGEERNTVLERITGLTVQEIESEWRAWLGAYGPAPTFYPSPTFEYRVPAIPTMQQFPTSTGE
ncbi:MAG: hypothetical protein L0154_27790 [Chloroflexi bacterium]|nr:hypothetical protein [Chloroflexota bacterium]